LQVKKYNDYTDPNSEEWLTTLRALNIYLSEMQVHHERTCFTFIDMITQVGGLVKGFFVIGFILLYPHYYKLEEITVVSHVISINYLRWF